ncbi:hypothetical protein GCM10009841_12410 [Microlunatus panaciterrae]|uniref:RDD family membrane protein YckC n=1 Tax=Microlunatus panaciterrae TaxID=400768 RepID=A0ABS2RLB0_9ACTN|nr:putative RDD family membrane protein YckC [Microlunatus panaciterrae]
MSDIPVGSPPVPPGRHAAPSGWYPDPVDPSQERYWDGWQWSRNTRQGQRSPGPFPQYPSTQHASTQHTLTQHPSAQPGPYRPPGVGVAGTQAVQTADGVPLAGWWWRVLAVVVDSFIVSALASIPSIPIYQKLFVTMARIFRESFRAAEAGQPPPPVPFGTDLISTGDQLLLTMITVVVGFCYYALFWRFKSATPGKLVCGLRIVPVDQGRRGDRLAWSAVLARTAVWVLPGISGVLLLVQLLDVLFPLWQPKRQALHDLAAKTQVVKIR